ncbi:Hypothetical_protein [Hexamita inflata]|uniref:Hypothetical_protein n=1 Tax=Hexamita inflata TaxID=28002 RepID=A0AA86TCZ1_9EUKA|nr:Hypothetical protein HINF_LOCUS1816 [Hexamita inflata]
MNSPLWVQLYNIQKISTNPGNENQINNCIFIFGQFTYAHTSFIIFDWTREINALNCKFLITFNQTSKMLFKSFFGLISVKLQEITPREFFGIQKNCYYWFWQRKIGVKELPVQTQFAV